MPTTSKKKRTQPRKGRRTAIVAGLRSPFVKSSTVFSKHTSLDLASRVVGELLARTNLSPSEIDQVVYGQVVPNVAAPNIAREVVLATGMPHAVDAYSVSRACATSTQAIVNGALAIENGAADVVIAGGVESLSKPPITFSDGFVQVLMKANSARDTISKAKAFADLKLKDLAPVPPAIAEFSTGETMGQSAEKMAKLNGCTREEQDEIALLSHQRAAKAWENGVYEQEVMAVETGRQGDEPIAKDTMVRADTSAEKLGKLRPVFDRKFGSVTAGNSSPLTDGASAVVLMSEAKAEALGLEPLAFVKSWGFAAIDPAWQLLLGPAFASPKALDAAGMELNDCDLIDMHEAFAAQIVSNVKMLESDTFAREYLGRSKAVGSIDMDKFNVHGGSISLGHPFAATGARQALTMANELKRRGGGTALVTQCAAGGLGAALVLERD